MFEDVAVINEVPEIGSPRVHSDSNARVRTIPWRERYIDGIEELSTFRRYRHAVLGKQQEMPLIDAEMTARVCPDASTR